jgi:hypothetical protein
MLVQSRPPCLDGMLAPQAPACNPFTISVMPWSVCGCPSHPFLMYASSPPAAEAPPAAPAATSDARMSSTTAPQFDKSRYTDLLNVLHTVTTEELVMAVRRQSQVRPGWRAPHAPAARRNSANSAGRGSPVRRALRPPRATHRCKDPLTQQQPPWPALRDPRHSPARASRSPFCTGLAHWLCGAGLLPRLLHLPRRDGAPLRTLGGAHRCDCAAPLAWLTDGRHGCQRPERALACGTNS